jgi:hypothetical protein
MGALVVDVHAIDMLPSDLHPPHLPHRLGLVIPPTDEAGLSAMYLACHHSVMVVAYPSSLLAAGTAFATFPACVFDYPFVLVGYQVAPCMCQCGMSTPRTTGLRYKHSPMRLPPTGRSSCPT